MMQWQADFPSSHCIKKGPAGTFTGTFLWVSHFHHKIFNSIRTVSDSHLYYFVTLSAFPSFSVLSLLTTSQIKSFAFICHPRFIFIKNFNRLSEVLNGISWSCLLEPNKKERYFVRKKSQKRSYSIQMICFSLPCPFNIPRRMPNIKLDFAHNRFSFQPLSCALLLHLTKRALAAPLSPYADAPL